MKKNVMSLKATVNNIAKKEQSISTISFTNIYARKIIRANICF